MIYRLSRGTASFYIDNPEYPVAPWLVEKVLQGHGYTIGTFLNRDDAEACWLSLRQTLEVSRGATHEESF